MKSEESVKRLLILLVVAVIAVCIGLIVWRDKRAAEHSWDGAGHYLKKRHDQIRK